VTTVILDAGVIIGALDAADAHHPASVAALGGPSRDDLVVPASVISPRPHRAVFEKPSRRRLPRIRVDPSDLAERNVQ
jgi:hypothetical protein